MQTKIEGVFSGFSTARDLASCAGCSLALRNTFLKHYAATARPGVFLYGCFEIDLTGRNHRTIFFSDRSAHYIQMRRCHKSKDERTDAALHDRRILFNRLLTTVTGGRNGTA